jgi:Glycosyltransferase like family
MLLKENGIQARAITFVVAVNKKDILERNFLASPCLIGAHPHQIILQENFTSAAAAYNDAIDESVNDLIVFCHQDMFFPSQWMSQLEDALECLKVRDPNWGVLGCCGITADGEYRGYVYSSGVEIIGAPSEPAEIQTLDEIVLIFRKSSTLRFDQELPHFHLYGTDICLRAAMLGMKNYAISALCIHNTYQAFDLPKEFFECCRHIRRVWKDRLPVQTTCVRITRSSIPLYLRRLKQAYFKYVRRKEHRVSRVADVGRLLELASAKTHFRELPQ